MDIKARHKRLVLIAIGLILLGLGVMLILNALKSNMVFFYTPTQVVNGEVPAYTAFRVGGLVSVDSLMRLDDGLTVNFKITDTFQTIPVIYKGILPDLFKEGKGVVAQGKIRPDGVFDASEVLAKHDENYMPPEAAEAIKRAKEHSSSSLVSPK